MFSHILCTIIQNITKKLINQKHEFFYSKCNHYSTWLFIIFAGESNGNVIRSNQPSVVLTEGSSTSLSCSYDGSAYSLHWYRQKPGSKPEFLLLIVESSKYVNKADQPHPHTVCPSDSMIIMVWIWRCPLLLYQTLQCIIVLCSPLWQKNKLHCTQTCFLHIV